MVSLPADPGVPTTIVARNGASRAVWDYVAELGAVRPLLVCGRHVQAVGMLEPILAAQPRGVDASTYAEVEPDPSDLTVTKAGEVAALTGADIVIGIGGGSSIDGAKAVAAEALDRGWISRQAVPGRPTDIPRGALPLIAVPTTAGTGSEVTPFSVITFAATERKLVLNHPDLQPRAALLDPELLTTAPRDVRVAAGMDALTHAVESYVSRQATGATREFSLQAIELIAPHLRPAAAHASDAEAQAAMQIAAAVAGLAFCKTRLGIVHAMALPLSAIFHVPHGAANAILLPHGMAFNAPAVPDEYAQIAQALGEQAAGQTRAEAGALAVEAVRRLAHDIGAPSRMAEVGVRPEAIERMAADAVQSAHIATNPRPVALEDILRIYRQAL
jgi:alcohol dehydrogenase